MSIGPEYKKRYGLIVPKSKEAAPVKKRPLSSIFNEESSEEEAPGKQPHLKKSSFKNMKRQAKIDIQRALEEDPSVYQYDEIYDDMKERKEKKVAVAKQDKTSKYAKSLIRNAAVRKLENDRQFERKCQRELDEEDGEFADKDSYITASYRNKLAELAVLEEEHKRMAEEDARNDVTKKRDLTDFYRNILSLRTEQVSQTQEEKAGDTKPGISEPAREPKPGISEPAREPKPGISEPARGPKPDKRRNYRARAAKAGLDQQDTDSGESGTEDTPADTPNAATKDTSEKESGDVVTEKGTGDVVTEKGTGNVVTMVTDATKAVPREEENPDKDVSSSSSSDESGGEEDPPKTPIEVNQPLPPEEALPAAPEEPKPKILLSAAQQREQRVVLVREVCRKRNTAETVEAAVKRYWERRAEKQAAVS